MKAPRIIYIFLLLCIVLTACTEYHDFERRLSVADTLMNEQPDSAYRMLCAMNEEADRLPLAQRMHHLLLRSNAQNKADVLFTSDSIGNLLVKYYDQYGTPNERMLAHYMKGCAYRDMGDQPAALRCYNDALAAADTFMTDCDYDQLSIIYGQIARIFRHRAMPDNAIEAYEMAERFAWKAKDTVNVLTIWGNKSNALINQGKIQDALRIKEAAAGEFRRMGYPQYAAQVMGPCIKWYARQRDFSKAKAAMDNYETLSGYFQGNGEVKPGMEDYYHIKGTYYLEKGQLDSAEHYFHKLQTEGKSTNDRYLASWGLSQLYKKTGQSDSVAKYAFLNSVQNDSIYNEQTAQNLQNAQAQYDYARHQENALRKELETQKTQLRLYKWIAGSIIILVLLMLFILFLHNRNRKKAQAIEGLNQLIEGMNKVIKQNATDLQMKEKLEESINMLEEKLESYRKKEEIHSRTHDLNTLLQHPTVKSFMEMGKDRQGIPSYEDWHALYPLVEEYWPKLAECRKDISDVEYQICILTKLGLRASDIAHLTHNSSSNITNIRTRLLAKLFDMEGGAKDFDMQIKSL